MVDATLIASLIAFVALFAIWRSEGGLNLFIKAALLVMAVMNLLAVVKR